jgi:ADP-dependent NAD(P)H-hydrate dehydratase / NAD(P)H-hydrate epimerase
MVSLKIIRNNRYSINSAKIDSPGMHFCFIVKKLNSLEKIVILSFVSQSGRKMKILNNKQVKEADAYTIENEPVSSVDLMERAAKAVSRWLTDNFPVETRFRIFAGPGNNGGDGLAIGRLLREKGYVADIYLTASASGYSHDTEVNIGRLRAVNAEPEVIWSKSDFPPVASGDIIIDALFGTGLSRALSGLPAQLIDYLNSSGARIVAVDMPSGLFGDDNRDNNGAIIKAVFTLSLQLPKLAFMFSENYRYVGRWEVLPIGLHDRFLNDVDTPFVYTDIETVKPFIKTRERFSHKGTFGHCLLISGAYGKMGAAVLASTSCLRTGSGLLTTHVPSRGCEILQSGLPEAMTSIDSSEIYFSKLPPLDQFDAVGAGPAIGTGQQTQKALLDLLQSVRVPLVLDADALNIISMNREWITLIPENSILTPHPGEFDRLAGQHKNSHDRLITQIELAKKYKIIVVLKGACTSIATPTGKCFFNGSGNPGMATAGSGDVLTGILLSLLGQGYKPVEAAIAGVFIHGMAGDFAAENSQETLIAGDISNNLGKVFNVLKK